MPTVLVLDVSLSMIRPIPGQTDDVTYHLLAVHGINQFLDYLTASSKLEYVSLVSTQLFHFKFDIGCQIGQYSFIMRKEANTFLASALFLFT